MVILKKKLLSLCLLLFLTTAAIGQTFLPTSWNCIPGTLPDGWSTNVVSYYTSSAYLHSAPNAAKFDATGVYLSVNFVDDPDTLIYYLRGAAFTGGTFTIEQSITGSTWTAVRTFTNANIPNTTLIGAAPFKDILSVNTRFVRFIYTAKVSGNVSVDDILITKHPIGPEANIKIKLNSQFIPSTGTAVVGNAPTTSIMVINSGLDSVLHITAADIAGADAAMFNTGSIPLNVPPNDSAILYLNFNPTGADGTKTASLSLTNNDADKNPYILNLWAVKGCCATEPTGEATNLNLTNVSSYRFMVNFSDAPVPPERYIMLKKTSPITEEPLDGHTYLKGDFIGNAQVAYVGGPVYINPAYVVANTHYYIKVFSYNGQPGYENYLTTAVAAKDTLTPPNMIGTYYDAINFSSPALWNDLHTLINNHTNLFYDDYINNLINNFENRDTVVAGHTKKVITCAYSGENLVYNEPFAFTVYSREHVYCESWMPTYNNANYTSLPEFSDYHNLQPVDQNKVNVYRLNYPLGKVQTIQYQYLGCKKGLDSLGHVVFEPRDNIKGDAARCMFYQILCYDGVSGNPWFMPEIIDTASMPYGENLDLLKKWNQQDTPDNYEIARNDFIKSIQNNRNPFIDHPELADLFNFDIYTDVISNTNDDSFVKLYPTVNNGLFSIYSDSKADVKFSLYDGLGVLKFSSPVKSKSVEQINLTNCSSGMYFYSITCKDNIIAKGKIIVNK